MDLTGETLRDMLIAVFGVDERYVIPRQGNWWNPQDSLPTEDRPMTWVAYSIEDDSPIDLAHFQGVTAGGGGNDSVQHRVSSVALQFVGARGHEMALSVGHWIHNQTVRGQLAIFEGQLFGDVGGISVVDFAQDGLNTVKAFTVRLRIAWVSRIPTGQGIMEDLDFQGKVV